jgi:hypothetical protein
MSTLSTIEEVMLLVGGFKSIGMVLGRIIQLCQFSLSADAKGTPHWQQASDYIDREGVHIVWIGLENGRGE